MNMNDKAANNEANADASGTSNSRERELELDGDDGEEFTNSCSQQSRETSQDDAHTHDLGGSTPATPVSPLSRPTREMEIANEDDPLMSASRMAAAFKEMEEGSAIKSPAAAAAPLCSVSLDPTPPPARPVSAREGLTTDEDEEDERTAPAARSPLSHAGIEILNEDNMPPMPAITTAAAYEEMEHNKRNSMDRDPLLPPMCPMQADLTAAILEDKGQGRTAYEETKTIEEDDSQQAQDPPIPAVHSRFRDNLAASSDASEALDEVPIPTATANIDPVLPHLKSYAAAADDDNNDIDADFERIDGAIKELSNDNNDNAPVPPAQSDADFERMDGAIKELSNGNNVDAPVPTAQFGADFERVDEAIKELTNDNIDNAPVPTAQSGADFERMDGAIKKLSNDNNGNAPVPMSQFGADFERMDEAIKELSKTPLNVEDMPMHPSQIAAYFDNTGKARAGPLIVEQEETLQEGDGPVVARAPFPTALDSENMDTASLQQMHERVPEEDTQHSSANRPVRTGFPAITTQHESGATPPRRTQPAIVLPMRPPPRSMLPFPDNDDVTDAPSGPTLQVEATLYQQDPMVYLGTPVDNDLRPRWKKHRVSIAIAVSGLIAGLVVALWATLGFDREPALASNQTSETQSFLPSLEPSRSSPPSKIPSIHPTLHPSQSTAPSFVSSAPPSTSLFPSASPSSSSSMLPSASTHPTTFCFEGAVNILTDSHPDDTSWTLSRITTEGVTSAKLVGEGSPQDESSPHTYEVCLERGDYEFTIFDSFGDGICCDNGAGHFELVLDGRVVLEGGEFESRQTVSFSLPIASLPPSQSSVPTRSLSPTFRPSTSFGPSSQVPSFGPTLSLRPSPLPSLPPTAPPSTYWSSLVWEQTGQTINGEAPWDQSGRAVVLSGDSMTMAIGSPGVSTNDDRPGYVKVYHREDNASSWQDLGQKIEGTENGNRFGTSLAFSEDGKTLAIGAPGHLSHLYIQGYVRVYQLEGSVFGSSWKQLGKDITHESGVDKFGVSIALSENGRTLAIGDNVQRDYAGLVRIYDWDDDGLSWKQLGQDLEGEDPDDVSGSSVDLSSDGMTVAIGAPMPYGEDSGHVRVYHRKGDGASWEQLGEDINGEAPGDQSGFSISLSADGRTLAIGAIYNDGNGGDSGHARVYRIDDAGSSWEQLGQDIDGEAAGDEFGGSLSLSADGKTVAIGARANYIFTGHVKVYRLKDGPKWKQVGSNIEGERPYHYAGFSVSLSADGGTVAIGSVGVGGDSTGHVRVFNINY